LVSHLELGCVFQECVGIKVSTGFKWHFGLVDILFFIVTSLLGFFGRFDVCLERLLGVRILDGPQMKALVSLLELNIVST
jgi:hypothetical protein